MKGTPVSLTERIGSLDIIRGFALFGILLVNMPTFHSPDFITQLYDVHLPFSPLDHFIRLIFDMFVQTKFYTIFSFLFGLGFYIFMSRAEQKRLKVYRLFSRRLLVLLVFGLLHLIFLWFGDILHTYALVGFFLLLFYKKSNRAILGWAFGFLIVAYALQASQLFMSSSFIAEQQAYGATKMKEALKMYQDAPYGEWLSYHLKTEVSLILSNAPFMILFILPMFLFGLYAGRRGVFQQSEQNCVFLTRVWWMTLMLSVPLIAAVAFIHYDVWAFGALKPTAQRLFVGLSGLTLCFFYMSSLVLLLRKETWQKRLRPLGFVGQMALTNYLMQTFLSLGVVFGFDLFGKMSLGQGLLLSLGIYAFEVVFSYFWLKKYQFGPFEWLWRSLTYGYVQPWKRREESTLSQGVSID
jgi:uncharacterized protein